MAVRKSVEGQAQFGVIGLGVMGQNLALNLEEHGESVAVWNREGDMLKSFVAAHPGLRIVGTPELGRFVAALARPRRILMMIKAGDAVDQMLERMAPLVEPGDIVIDGGNSYFQDTRRREQAMRGRGLHFFGMGVSGGEEGARHGPSLMPGGAEGAYRHVEATLESIAARSEFGPCVTYVGSDGAGHFVKMVHNGIEYGDMQLIAEAYDLMRRGLGLTAPEMAGAFAGWNRGQLAGYLVEISAEILRAVDPEVNRPMVDMVLDKAGQKGTGKWTAQVALDLGVPVPTISAALDGRALSSMKEERVEAARRYGRVPGQLPGATAEWIEALGQALYAAKICCYAQGMSLIGAGAREWGWKIQLREMARIWTGGCIIRARLLNEVMRAYEKEPALANLLLDGELQSRLRQALPAWRRVVAAAAELGVPAPAFAASLAYFDAYTSAELPQNLTQAQRDYFGAHTYQRADRPEAGFVHSDWSALGARRES